MDRAEPVQDVILGEVIGGYRLDRLIGAGSTSKVFLGTHVLLGRTAAIKVLAPALVSNKDVVARLLTEARVVNDIRHPNIIDIIDFVVTESPPRVALVMELIEGPSLKAMRESPLSYEQAVGVALQLVDAVAAAHAAGVIHRDIKPDNLLLTSDPRPDKRKTPVLKIVDFGIAKLAGSSGKTVTGMMLGTPAYMAPEQVAGRPPPSAATDVFAIGEVLYEILTGERAYPAVAIHETVRAKLRGELPELNLPPIPGDAVLLALIKRCLALKPTERPSVEDIKSALLDVAPRAESFVAEASSRKSARATPQAQSSSPPPKLEAPRPPQRSSVARVPLPPNEATADVSAFRAQQAVKVSDLLMSDSTAENQMPITQPNPAQRNPDEITDRGPRTDPLTKFAEVVLDHTETELDLSDQETRAAGSTAGIPAAATEVMHSRFAERADPRAARRIPAAESSPTNVAMPGLTVAMSASPEPEIDEPAGTEVTVLGTRARRGLLEHAGVQSDMPETQLALPKITADDVVSLEGDTAEIEDGAANARIAEQMIMREVAHNASHNISEEVSVPYSMYSRTLEPETPSTAMPVENSPRERGDTRDPRETNHSAVRDPASHRSDPRDPRDLRDSRDGRESRDGRDPRDSRDGRESRDGRDPRDSRDGRDGRDGRDSRDPNARDVLLASRDLGSPLLPREGSTASPSPSPLFQFPSHGSVPSRSDYSPSPLLSNPGPRGSPRSKRRWLAVTISVLWFVAAGLLILSLVLRRGHDNKPTETPEVVKVSVGSRPIGARVEVAASGEHLGNTPLDLSFPKESVPRTLRLSSPGYDTVNIDISPSNAKVWVELEPSTKN